MLLALDAVLILLHVLNVLNYFPERYSALFISTNLGYGEIYQYIKCVILLILLVKLFIRSTWPIFLPWMVLFAYILLDDSLEIHEFLGFQLVRSFDFIGNKTLGEFLVFIILGIILLAPILALHIKSSKSIKIFDQDMLILFSMMIIAGVGMDILHDFAKNGTVIRGLLGILEDGGEMIVLSFIVWYVHSYHKYMDKVPE